MKGASNTHAVKIERMETEAATPKLFKTGCWANAKVPKAATVVVAEMATAANVETGDLPLSKIKNTPNPGRRKLQILQILHLSNL